MNGNMQGWMSGQQGNMGDLFGMSGPGMMMGRYRISGCVWGDSEACFTSHGRQFIIIEIVKPSLAVVNDS